jgi:hypothetical protein
VNGLFQWHEIFFDVRFEATFFDKVDGLAQQVTDLVFDFQYVDQGKREFTVKLRKQVDIGMGALITSRSGAEY